MSGSGRAILASAGMVLLVGCSPSDRQTEVTDTSAETQNASAVPQLTGPDMAGDTAVVTPAPPPSTSSSKLTPERGVCQVEPPASWRRALSKPTGADQEPFANLLLVHEDGSRADALYSASGNGEAVSLSWTSAEGETVEVLDLSSLPGQQQVLGADFDGRYLVYSLYQSQELFLSPWQGHIWDSVERGDPMQFAASPEEAYPDGEPGAMPLMYPLVHDGVAYWVQSDPTEQERESRALMSYDVGTRSTETLGRGPFNDPLFFGESILTVASPVGGRDEVAQIALGEHAPTLPSELLEASDLTEIAGDGNSLAWVDNQKTLYLYDPDGGAVTTIAGSGIDLGDQMGNVSAIAMNADVLSFYGQEADDEFYQYVYDHRSGSLTTQGAFGNSDFKPYPGFVSLHHTNVDGTQMVGSAVVAPMSDLPPLPKCETE